MTKRIRNSYSSDYSSAYSGSDTMQSSVQSSVDVEEVKTKKKHFVRLDTKKYFDCFDCGFGWYRHKLSVEAKIVLSVLTDGYLF